MHDPADTGYGVGIGAGLEWSDASRGLSASLQGWGVIGHGSGGLRLRGASGTLVYDPTPGSDRGICLTLEQSVGETDGNELAALLGSHSMAGQAAVDDADGPCLELDVGYGLSA